MIAGWSVLFERPELLTEVTERRAGGADPAKINRELRDRGYSPDEAAALLGQADLRSRARLKFGAVADRMLFTRAGLEQATRASVSTLHAQRFVAAGCREVADLGCGIGTESLALAAAGLTPRPVELDPFTARIAEHNLAEAGHPTPVAVGDAESYALPGSVDGVFLDPARRTAGHRDTRRLTNPDDYSPSLAFAFGLGERFAAGVKLGPGFDRDLIPERAEAQWVSVDGQVVEMGLWFGAAARRGVQRSALVMRGTQSHEIAAAADAGDAAVRALGSYIYEPDGAVIRARLIGKLAEHLSAGMISPGIAYLTGETAVETPFASGFRVLEELPVKEKQLKRALAEREIGTLEIKKRGANIDPAALRTRLRLRGPRSATLILTRVSERHVALLVERVR